MSSLFALSIFEISGRNQALLIVNPVQIMKVMPTHCNSFDLKYCTVLNYGEANNPKAVLLSFTIKGLVNCHLQLSQLTHNYN